MATDDEERFRGTQCTADEARLFCFIVQPGINREIMTGEKKITSSRALSLIPVTASLHRH
jgi:hypothetical protein